MSTDSDLLGRYLDSGDQSAVAELLSRHAGMVHAAARRLAPSDADDITQAVFILLLRKASSLRKQPNLAGWLYQTTLYCARNVRRSQNRRDHHERQAPMPEPTPSPDPAIRDLLDTALTKLTQKYRDVLLLRYLEGLSISESARRLGISPEAIEKRAERALAKLRATLASAGHEIPAAGLITLLSAEAAHHAPTSLLPAILTPTAKAATLAKSAGAAYAAAHLKAAAIVVLGISAIAGGTIAAVHAANTPGPQVTAAATTQRYVHHGSPEESRVPGPPGLYCYSVGVEEPVARAIEKLGAPLPGKENAYRLYLADAEQVRQLLQREFAAGNVSGMRMLAHPQVGPVRPGEQRPWSGATFGAYRTEISNSWGISANAHFPEGGIVGTPSGLQVTARMLTTNVSAADDRYRGAVRTMDSVGATAIDTELYPGEALVGVLDLGAVGNVRRCHIYVLHCLRITPEQAATLDGASESVQWLRVGPAGMRTIADYAAAYRAAATQPTTVRDESAWTKTLSDGTTIRLTAIGLPVRYPFILWDPDGNPLAEQGSWCVPTDRNRGVPDSTTIGFDIVSATPIGMTCQEMRRPDGGTSYQYRSRSTWDMQSVPNLTVRMGIGPWQNAGKIEKGSPVHVGPMSIEVNSIEPSYKELRIQHTLRNATDQCITFVAVTESGKRIWPSHCSPTLFYGPGGVGPINMYQSLALLWYGDEKVDHLELLWRRTETVRFTGYAMVPSEHPPFDLARDFTLRATAQPSRVATSRPALDPKDLPAASMQQLLAAARTGDLAAVETYFTGGTPQQRTLAAKMILYTFTTHETFTRRFGTPPAGRFGAAPAQMERALLDKDIVINDANSASSKMIAYRRSPDGKWCIDVTTMVQKDDVDALNRQVEPLRRFYEQLTAGQYPTAVEAQKALDTLLPK